MQQDSDTGRGYAYALGAFGLWGLFPLYMKQLAAFSPAEIVAHRIIWAVPVAALILASAGRLASMVSVFRSPRTVVLGAVTAMLVSVNWGIYVYAIVNGQALAAALGYYINPLVNVALGAVFLRERPNPLQAVAIGLATLGVAIMTAAAGGLPWLSLGLAVSFGVYGLLRKTLPIGAAEGFFLEVILLLAPALAYLVWIGATGGSRFTAEAVESALLIGAGPLTAISLILYAAGARRLHFSTIGILQYISPTMIFLTAVFLFGEPFSATQLLSYVLIWIALAIYSWSLVRQAQARRAAAL